MMLLLLCRCVSGVGMHGNMCLHLAGSMLLGWHACLGFAV